MRVYYGVSSEQEIFISMKFGGIVCLSISSGTFVTILNKFYRVTNIFFVVFAFDIKFVAVNVAVVVKRLRKVWYGMDQLIPIVWTYFPR